MIPWKSSRFFGHIWPRYTLTFRPKIIGEQQVLIWKTLENNQQTKHPFDQEVEFLIQGSLNELTDRRQQHVIQEQCDRHDQDDQLPRASPADQLLLQLEETRLAVLTKFIHFGNLVCLIPIIARLLSIFLSDVISRWSFKMLFWCSFLMLFFWCYFLLFLAAPSLHSFQWLFSTRVRWSGVIFFPFFDLDDRRNKLIGDQLHRKRQFHFFDSTDIVTDCLIPWRWVWNPNFGCAF